MTSEENHILFHQTVCVNHEYVEVTFAATTWNPNIIKITKYMACKNCGKFLEGNEQVEYIENQEYQSYISNKVQ